MENWPGHMDLTKPLSATPSHLELEMNERRYGPLVQQRKSKLVILHLVTRDPFKLIHIQSRHSKKQLRIGSTTLIVAFRS